MNTNSNSYTIIYASIMVVIVAFLLAFVSSSLKEKQYQNVEQDTKKQILAALNVYDVKDVNADYDKYVKEDDLMQADGSLVKNDAAFQTSYKGEIANGRLHVFVCDVDGQTKYVLPIYGAGLWGPIWGYIALNDDKDTVYGVYFSHQGDNEVREGCNNGYGKTHHDSRFQLSRYSQCRTDTEHLYGDRVIQTQRS